MLKTDSKVKVSNIFTLFYSSSPFLVKSRNDKFTIQLSVKNKKDSAYNTRVLVQYSPNIIFAGIEVGIFHIIPFIITYIAREIWGSLFIKPEFHCSGIISFDWKRFPGSAILAFPTKRLYLFWPEWTLA